MQRCSVSGGLWRSSAQLLLHCMPQEMGYRETAGDEVEDLAALLAFAKERFPVSGALAMPVAACHQGMRPC